ncbi:hypothetical protein POL25_04480 [Nannocystis sp. bb15-2]|uniref:Low affinity Fe/Cu permease n=2 Tax=Nannocystis bainbridge TaxID=2995303 RepID=A0ABT5DR60_9BACT|nr:hypothetical protein [Nannocystis bainbridge]
MLPLFGLAADDDLAIDAPGSLSFFRRRRMPIETCLVALSLVAAGVYYDDPRLLFGGLFIVVGAATYWAATLILQVGELLEDKRRLEAQIQDTVKALALALQERDAALQAVASIRIEVEGCEDA